MNPADSNSRNRNPKALLVLLILSGSLFVVIFLGLLLHAIYRRYRRAIWSIWFRLRNMDPNAPENRYPAALPTRQSKRFAGVRVVDGNAILTKKDYHRLRAQTPILLQIDDIGSAQASEDFSRVEILSVTTFSRADSIASPRLLHREEREGFGGNSQDAMSNIDLDSVEMEMLQTKENIARERNRAALLTAVVEPDGSPTTAVVVDADKPRKLSLPKRLLKHVTSQHTLDPATGVTIVTAISREDLQAHLAAEEARIAEDATRSKKERIAQLIAVPFSPLLSPGVDRDYSSGNWDRSVSESYDAMHVSATDKADPLSPAATGDTKKKLALSARNAPTMAQEYGSLSDENDSPTATQPGGAGGDDESHHHSTSSSSSVTSSEPSQFAGSFTTSNGDGATLPALSVRSLRSVRFTLPSKEKKTNGTTEKQKKKTRRHREVRREVHRHHVNQGGFIICKDDDEEVRRKLDKRKTSRSEPTTPKRVGKNGKKEKKRFVFQRRPSEEFYGTAEYLPAPSTNATESGTLPK